jgi:hypothetical protein
MLLWRAPCNDGQAWGRTVHVLSPAVKTGVVQCLLLGLERVGAPLDMRRCTCPCLLSFEVVKFQDGLL